MNGTHLLRPTQNSARTNRTTVLSRAVSTILLSALTAIALLWTHSSRAEDAYFHVPLTSLSITEGTLPTEPPSGRGAQMDVFTSLAMQPYASLNGEGEVYVGGPTLEPWMPVNQRYHDSFLAIRAPADKEITGLLFVPKADNSGMVRLPFKIAPGTNNTPKAQREFLAAKEAHYRELRSRNIPGAAWFRHEEDEAIAARTGKAASSSFPPEQFAARRRGTEDETYSLFTGGRAVSENLQLDRALPAGQPGAKTKMVEVASIEGIKVAPMDWKPLLQNLKPDTDPLAASIPADQHALFFPSFQAMMSIMDEADTNGTPLLQMIVPRAEDMDTRHRYQKQLCLGLSEISRRIGPEVVDAIALTGSDPYLRMGTDVGVLFQTKNPDVLKSLITAQQALVCSGAAPEAKAVAGEIEGVAYTGVVSSDRSISSYVASVGQVVFVSNSHQQLGCLIAAGKGSKPALVSQDEYVFFRSRYRRGDPDESAFLVLSDATIRRWCGPRWRIANSRRTRASAALAELQAGQFDALVKGTAQPGSIKTDLQFPDSGELSLTRQGVSSSTYGALDFMTPIAEMPFTQVTAAEADSYTRWRDSYQQNWSQAFDPMAARFSVQPGRISFELTVMPLIMRTEYRDMVSLSSGAQIAAGAGDPHPGTLAHLIMAVDTKSAPMNQAGSFLAAASPALKVNPFGWMGSSIALYADDDPFWSELQQAKDPDQFMEGRWSELPLALRFEVRNALGAATFLGALRAYADQTAPGMANWVNLQYQGQSYVKVTSPNMGHEPNQTKEPAIFYATTPESLVVTLNEALLKRALDRQASNAAAKSKSGSLPSAATPWLGTNLCLQLDQKFFRILERVAGETFQNSQQRLAWSNLPILNEWKRRFPDQDPVKLHEQFWQTKLVCPGGGAYVWNEKWQTMESTVYGHPGEPKAGPANFGPLTHLVNANLGLNFENQGLSAKAVFNRSAN